MGNIEDNKREQRVLKCAISSVLYDIGSTCFQLDESEADIDYIYSKIPLLEENFASIKRYCNAYKDLEI